MKESTWFGQLRLEQSSTVSFGCISPLVAETWQIARTGWSSWGRALPNEARKLDSSVFWQIPGTSWRQEIVGLPLSGSTLDDSGIHIKKLIPCISYIPPVSGSINTDAHVGWLLVDPSSVHSIAACAISVVRHKLTKNRLSEDNIHWILHFASAGWEGGQCIPYNLTHRRQNMSIHIEGNRKLRLSTYNLDFKCHFCWVFTAGLYSLTEDRC